jgi:hypothetical protein
MLPAVATAVVAVIAAALAATPAVRAAGTQQLPATCIANIYDPGNGTSALDTLSVGIYTPEYPLYWDVTPPVGAWAMSTGLATVTPSGELNVSCSHTVSRYNDGSTDWPAGTFTRSVQCGTAIGGDANGYGAKIYLGRGKVTIVGNGHESQPGYGGQVTITCHATYRYTNPPHP